MTTTDDGSTKPGEMSGRVDSVPDQVPAATPALPPSCAAQALGNGSSRTAQTCGVDAKQSDYAEALADSPLMRFKEMPRAMFNPLQGCGRGKTWAEDAKAQLAFIEFKLAAIRARNQAVCEKGGVERQLREWWLGTTPLSDSQVKATCRSVGELLLDARLAAYGQCPRYRPILSWWSGAGTESAYRKIHYAEAAIARLYSAAEIKAELPDVVRRLNAALPADNPSRIYGNSYLRSDCAGTGCTPAELSFLIALGHEASDRNRAKLRVFRNVMLIGILVMTLVLAGVTALAWLSPSLLPLCFIHEAAEKTNFIVSCPTSDYSTIADSGKARHNADVFAIALMGVVGGALSGAIFIRGMSSNPTPYNVGIPLALLKLPFGGLTAVIGTLLLAGDFVPGFTAIDKQAQILAYAIVFGFAQQFFTRYLDRRAENLLANLPSKGKDEGRKSSSLDSGMSPVATTE